MSELVTTRRSIPRRWPTRWPMTTSAWHALVQELGLLREQLRTLGGSVSNQPVHLPWVVARGRYETLSVVLDEAERVDASAGAVIGHRVTLREEDGSSVAYALVCPGSGDPDQGWVAADSPLGSALVHAEPGDRVEIRAPAGNRIATVLSVE